MNGMEWLPSEETVSIRVQDLIRELPLRGDLHKGRTRESGPRDKDTEAVCRLLLPQGVPAAPFTGEAGWIFRSVPVRISAEVKNSFTMDGGKVVWVFRAAVRTYGETDDRYRTRPEYADLIAQMFVMQKAHPDADVRGLFAVLPQSFARTRLPDAFESGFAERYDIRFSDPGELSAELEFCLWRYAPWIFLTKEHGKEIPESVGKASFPFASLRDGQREMILEWREDIKSGTTLFAEAPTGIGKTVSALYPSVLRIGDGLIRRIFYLTAKGSTRREAEKACRALGKGGAAVRSVTMQSLQTYCLRTGGYRTEACQADDCPFAAGFYERLWEAMEELRGGERVLTAERIRETGRRFGICPYALAQEIALYSEVVICDYNSVLDPVVYYRRFFGETRRTDDPFVLLFDESHNLADRIRSMYTAELKQSGWEQTYEEEGKPLEGCEQAVRAELHALGAPCRAEARLDADGVHRGASVFQELPATLRTKLQDWLDAYGKLPSFYRASRADLREKAENVERFLLIYAAADETRNGAGRKSHAVFVSTEEENTVLKLYCLDPAPMISHRLREARASLFFSATLTPQDCYAEVFGRGLKTACMDLKSPFPTERLCVTVADKLSMRAEDRDRQVRELVRYIAAVCSARKGHYLVYGPTFDYMKKLHAAFAGTYPSVLTKLQTQGMTYAQRNEFLGTFRNPDGKIRVGFCVLGSIFTEGIDLPGDQLIGVIILGTGMPALSSERNILSEYYDELNGKGFQYAYTYPGMNLVLQAAGRVIRDERDRGVVVLVDDRYAQPEMMRLFPAHWTDIRAAGDPKSLHERLLRFWNEKEE